MPCRTLVLVLVGLLLAVPASSDPDTQRAVKMERGCNKGCLRHTDDTRYCADYCACMRRAVFTGHTAREIDALIGVMRPDAPESPTKKAAFGMMDACVVEADTP